jgi:hypothetical protein
MSQKITAAPYRGRNDPRRTREHALLAGRILSRRAAAVCLISLAAGCGREAPAAKKGPVEPIAEVPPPSPTLSRFDVPLEYDFTPVLKEVERVVPRRLGSLDSLHQMGDDERRHYAYEIERGRFTTFMQGSQVHLRTTLSYAVRGYYNPRVGPTISAGCGKGDKRPEMVVEFVTPLTLGPNWHLHSAMKLARLEVASDSAEDRCKVSILRFDVTDRVVDAARKGLSAHLGDIDRQIAKIDLTRRATGWWADLSRPIRLTDGVWLLLQPRQLRAGQVAGTAHMLTLRVGLDAYPKVVTGAEPSAGVPPLPPLVQGTASNGFRIVVDGTVDYATASREITRAVRGKSLTKAGRTVTVQSATVSPVAGGRLALTVAFAGDASGTLRFVGTPRYDAARGQIVVPDLDYDLETDSDLVRAIAWIRSDDLRTLFRENARVPVAPVLERGKTLLTRGLNRKIGRLVTLEATVDTVTVEGLYVTRGGVVVRAGASGKAAVSVRERS